MSTKGFRSLIQGIFLPGHRVLSQTSSGGRDRRRWLPCTASRHVGSGPPPPPHSRARKAQRARPGAHDSGILSRTPRSGASGPFWPRLCSRGPRPRGAPWRPLWPGEAGAPGRPADTRPGRTGVRRAGPAGPPRRKEERLGDRGPRVPRRPGRARVLAAAAPPAGHGHALRSRVFVFFQGGDGAQPRSFFHPVGGRVPQPTQEF